ncbi:hypothetical protein D3C72_1191580 [compost metagenome]
MARVLRKFTVGSFAPLHSSIGLVGTQLRRSLAMAALRKPVAGLQSSGEAEPSDAAVAGSALPGQGADWMSVAACVRKLCLMRLLAP